jgi:rubredoxin
MVCGYIFDPNFSDPDNGDFFGVPFESLPKEWFCPDCGAGKDMFVACADEIDNSEEKDLFAPYSNDTEEEY